GGVSGALNPALNPKDCVLRMELTQAAKVRVISTKSRQNRIRMDDSRAKGSLIRHIVPVMSRHL
ncbi:MAG: hypothetical protein AAFQ51_19080, partial [Pseudomonadota bacterium]